MAFEAQFFSYNAANAMPRSDGAAGRTLRAYEAVATRSLAKQL
jgi:hypothetical protein